MSEITPDTDSPKGNGLSVASHDAIDEKTAVAVVAGKDDPKISETSFPSSEDGSESDRDNDDQIIITGADAADHLLPLRDDGDPAITFRSVVLASGLSCFQAVMYQIYMVSP